jgi:hypothetical protein
MNKKELAIGAIKHPIIQKLLETKLASSREIVRLILEEVSNDYLNQLKTFIGGLDETDLLYLAALDHKSMIAWIKKTSETEDELSKDQYKELMDIITSRLPPSEEEPPVEPEPAEEPAEEPPTEEPIITATVEIDEETANNYSNALEDFQRKFLNVRTLREQAAVLEPYFNIIKKLAGKLEPEEAKALTRTLEEEEGSKLNRDIVNTSNILIKHMDKIEEVLQAFKESAQTGTLGSNKLYLKYGEGDPKKFLMKFLKIVIKDINSLDEMFNRALLSGEEKPTEYEYTSSVEESLNEEKTEMSTDEIIDLVQAVHEVVSDEGAKLKAILFNTISGEERVTEETETDISVKDQAEAIYDQLARIQGFFPSISPFNNEYGFDEIIENFIQVVRGLHGLIAQINRYSRTNEKITEPLARSIQEKMQNIKSYLMNVFGVSDIAEKASTIGSLSDASEGTEYDFEEAPTVKVSAEDLDLDLDISYEDDEIRDYHPASSLRVSEQLTKKLKPIIERMLNG